MVRGTLDFFRAKIKMFPKVTERGSSHVIRRRIQVTQRETGNQTDHINMTLYILFYSYRYSTLPPLQGNREVRRATTAIEAECSISPSMAASQPATVNRMTLLNSTRVVGEPRYTRDFKNPLNQKSARIKSGDLEGHWVLQLRHITRSLIKDFSSRVLCGAGTCMKVTLNELK